MNENTSLEWQEGGAYYRVKWQSHFFILRAPGALNTENTVLKTKTTTNRGLIDPNIALEPTGCNLNKNSNMRLWTWTIVPFLYSIEKVSLAFLTVQFRADTKTRQPPSIPVWPRPKYFPTFPLLFFHYPNKWTIAALCLALLPSFCSRFLFCSFLSFSIFFVVFFSLAGLF